MGSGRSGADCQSQYDGRTGSGNEQPCGYGNFLPEHAAITSASLVQLLERSPLAKIFMRLLKFGYSIALIENWATEAGVKNY